MESARGCKYISSIVLYFIVCRFSDSFASGQAILQVFFLAYNWDQDGHLKVMNHSGRDPRTAEWWLATGL